MDGDLLVVAVSRIRTTSAVSSRGSPLKDSFVIEVDKRQLSSGVKSNRRASAVSGESLPILWAGFSSPTPCDSLQLLSRLSKGQPGLGHANQFVQQPRR